MVTDLHPMAGVRVVEFARTVAAPYAGMLLADLGADVVKLEPPTGDPMRAWPPLAHGEHGDSFSHSFAALNRNKRAVSVDLTSPGGVARAREVAGAADVVIEDHGPGALDELGVGYPDVIRGRERGLVYCSLSGFGPASPHGRDEAPDVVVQGLSGLMSVTGDRVRQAAKVGIPVGDLTAALYAALTVTAVLPSVLAGRQLRIDCPVLDCLLAVSALQTSESWATGEAPERNGAADPRSAPHQAFRASDREFTLAASDARQWQAVAEVAGVPELVADPRFRTLDDRIAHRGMLAGILQARFGKRRAAYWLRKLRARGVPCGPVNTYPEILADEHVRVTGLVQDTKVPVAGLTPTVVYPARISGIPSRLDRAAPELDADTHEVLADWGVA